MKKILCFVWMSLVLCLSSCVEEYNELPAEMSDPMLVVEGQIQEGECLFVLSKTGSLAYINGNVTYVSDANVSVVGSDGSVWTGKENALNKGHYLVEVGSLSAGTTYSLQISHSVLGSFESEPQYPLDAPAIDSIGFVGGNDNDKVSITIGTSEMTKETYLMWQYEECWEIWTPYIALWRYDEENDSLIFSPSNTNHGWCYRTQNPCIISSNVDYGGGRIPKMTLYSKDRDGQCFQTRYYTKVYQMAISKKEYEYRRLVEQQTLEMGGLFTPMPTELPSNLVGQDGKKAIGYIGVRGKIAAKDMYINKQDVGCTRNDTPYTEVTKGTEGASNLVGRGMVVYYYDSYNDEASWCAQWGVDCRTVYWGFCSLEKPDFWIDK